MGTGAASTKNKDDDEDDNGKEEEEETEEEPQQTNTTAAAAGDKDLEDALEMIGSWTTNSTVNNEDEERDDLPAVLLMKLDFLMLVFAIESTGLRNALSVDGPFTVFGTW